MNTSYYQNQVNRIENEIAALHKKMADESKKELGKNQQINSINRSITKNTSITTIQSKQRQIGIYQKDILNIRKKIAECQKNIATKTAELGKKKRSLLMAQQKEQSILQQNINNQKEQLEFLISQNFSAKNMDDMPDVDSNLEEENKQYDFFISHASEDKNEIVRELAEALKKSGFKVWYDEFELKLGDSLRRKIDYGLSNSKYGIVIISPSFIKKNWTEYELNGMVAREMNGHKVILPVWHKVTKDEVLKFSPTLADKLALTTSLYSIADIIEQLKDL